MSYKGKIEENRAKVLLLHYFDLLAERQGTKLDGDCRGEIESIINHIIRAAVEEVKDEIRTQMAKAVVTAKDLLLQDLESGAKQGGRDCWQCENDPEYAESCTRCGGSGKEPDIANCKHPLEYRYDMQEDGVIGTTQRCGLCCTKIDPREAHDGHPASLCNCPKCR